MWNGSPWRAVSANDVRLRPLLCVIVSFLPKDLDYIQRKVLLGEQNNRSICGEGQWLVYFIVCNLSCGLTFLSLLCSTLLCNGFGPRHSPSIAKTGWNDRRSENSSSDDVLVYLWCFKMKWDTSSRMCPQYYCLNLNKKHHSTVWKTHGYVNKHLSQFTF